MPVAKLPSALSIYLDLIRFLSALAVLASHFLGYPFALESPTGDLGMIARANRYGEAGVIIFFVLSGYVIAHVVNKREGDAVTYSISRISRLYSVVLPAILLTLFLDSVGGMFWPDFYSTQTIFWVQPSVSGYLSSLLFLNEFEMFHWAHTVPGTNGVFWSLSFEAAYYLLAGLILFVRRNLAIAGVGIVALLAGPTIIVLSPVWAVGYLLYHFQDRLRVPAPAFIFAATGCAIILFTQAAARLPMIDLPHGPDGLPLNIGAYYITGGLFALNLLAAYRLFENGSYILERFRKVIRYLSRQTFPLYAIHFPILCFFSASNPFPHWSVPGVLYMLVPVAILVPLTTGLSDWLRDAMRSSMSQRLTRSSPV